MAEQTESLYVLNQQNQKPKKPKTQILKSLLIQTIKRSDHKSQKSISEEKKKIIEQMERQNPQTVNELIEPLIKFTYLCFIINTNGAIKDIFSTLYKQTANYKQFSHYIRIEQIKTKAQHYSYLVLLIKILFQINAKTKQIKQVIITFLQRQYQNPHSQVQRWREEIKIKDLKLILTEIKKIPKQQLSQQLLDENENLKKGPQLKVFFKQFKALATMPLIKKSQIDGKIEENRRSKQPSNTNLVDDGQVQDLHIFPKQTQQNMQLSGISKKKNSKKQAYSQTEISPFIIKHNKNRQKKQKNSQKEPKTAKKHKKIAKKEYPRNNHGISNFKDNISSNIIVNPQGSELQNSLGIEQQNQPFFQYNKNKEKEIWSQLDEIQTPWQKNESQQESNNQQQFQVSNQKIEINNDIWFQQSNQLIKINRNNSFTSNFNQNQY